MPNREPDRKIVQSIENGDCREDGQQTRSYTPKSEPQKGREAPQCVKKVEVQEALPPAGVLGRREGAGIQWMQLPKAVSDWQPSTETRIWHGSAKDDD